MRQAGVLAAAGLVALEESPKRLHVDHENAKFLALGLAEIPGVRIDAGKIVSNILFLEFSGGGLTSFDISKRLAARGILANGVTPQTMRMVTHCDVDRAGCERALQVLREILGTARKTIVA
jgi:threonine aldolase